jgi:hypothetical protein
MVTAEDRWSFYSEIFVEQRTNQAAGRRHPENRREILFSRNINWVSQQ